MIEIWAVDPLTIERKKYGSAEELASHLAAIIHKSGKAISLYTDYFWYTEDCVVSPYVGKATNVSIGFDGYFSVKELIQALLKKGIYANRVEDQSFAYVLYTKNVGTVPALNMGCDVLHPHLESHYN